MGRFDDESTREAAPTVARSWLDLVARVAQGIDGAAHMRTPVYRAELVKRLTAQGWVCRSLVRVDARGTDDGYRGILDLVAHPPAAEKPMTIPPVLIEIDKGRIQRKTLAKLDRWEGPHAGKVVLLTRASYHPGAEGVDRVVTLA